MRRGSGRWFVPTGPRSWGRGGRTRICGTWPRPCPAHRPTPHRLRLRLNPSSWSAHTECMTRVAPSAGARSRRRWPSTSPPRCGSAATWVATGSHPTCCCCPTASTTATSTPRRRSAPCGSTWPARWRGVGCGAWPILRRPSRLRRWPRMNASGPSRPARCWSSRCTRSARTTATAPRPPSLLRVAGVGRVRVEVVAVRRPVAQLTCRASRETPATAYEIVSLASG